RRIFRDHGVVVGPADARGRLVEDDRLLRNRHAGLGGMIGIVEPDGDEVADAGDARADARLALHQWQLVDRRLADLGETLGRERFACQIRNHLGEIADAALGVDDSGLFAAVRAEADELHGAISPSRGWCADVAGPDHASDVAWQARGPNHSALLDNYRPAGGD